MRPERIFTYDSVWGLKRVFYHIERFRLPVPVSVTELLIVVFLEALFIYLRTKTSLVDQVPEIILFGIIPFGSAWLMSRLDLEGRPPYQFIYSVVLHFFSHKHWSKGVPIPKSGETEETHQLTRIVGGVKNYASDSYPY